MKRAHKKVVGFIGLAAVIIITAVAMMMPAQNTGAVTSSVTDTITVRVVNNVPNVDVVGITSGEVITVPEQTFSIQYQNAKTVTLTLDYTGLDGNTYESPYLLDIVDGNFDDGEETYNLHIIK